MRIKLVVLSLFVILVASLFYWYQIRPAQIKHDCSWVKMHANAIPYRPAMTQTELESKGIIRTCKNEFDLVKKIVPSYDINSGEIPSLFDANYTFAQTHAIWNATSCREDSDKVIAAYKNPIKAFPAKDWYEKASTQQYQFCLHDKGL